MTKEEFQSMSLVKQVDYYNERMKQGQTMSKISSELGISKSISAKFLGHGYTLNKTDNQYVLQEVETLQTLLNEVKQPQEEHKTIERVNILPKEEKDPTKAIESTKTHDKIEIVKEVLKEEPKKAIGRPAKQGREKTNITLDSDIKQELQIYCIKNKVSLSDLLEKLAVGFLKGIE
jgi:hypothetical protein